MVSEMTAEMAISRRVEQLATYLTSVMGGEVRGSVAPRTDGSGWDLSLTLGEERVTTRAERPLFGLPNVRLRQAWAVDEVRRLSDAAWEIWSVREKEVRTPDHTEAVARLIWETRREEYHGGLVPWEEVPPPIGERYRSLAAEIVTRITAAVRQG